MIGGRVKSGEATTETIKREIFEKLGKEIEILGLFAVVENFFNMKENDYHEIMLVFKKFIADYKYLLDKFIKIINFDSYNLKNNSDISNLGGIVSSLKIKTDNITYFGNELFLNICNSVNKRIDKILEKIEQLKAEVGAINGIIKTTIEKSKKEVNDFLEIAGFDYKFDITVEKDNEAKTLLKYSKNNEQEIDVDNIESHLSWGEKNAFALVLFMF